MQEVLRTTLGVGTPEGVAALQALTKIVFLDMSLAIDAYILSAQEELAKRAEELERANVDLRRLDAAKRHLTGAIVHDLQNPLAGIIAFLQVLGSRPQGLTDAEKRSLSEALARCNDLSTLILDVLQMNRAEEGRLELYLENLDLGEAGRHAVEAFTLVAEQSGKKLTYSGPGRGVTLRSDQSLLRRVLYNLIRNALQHTPAGTHVQVKVKAGPPWSVTVCDDGPGIPREIRERIFEPGALRSAGYQVQSGVGLVFCKRTASALGMNLRLSEECERGACFVLEPLE
jgi:signal transduction histidine kinase